MRLWAAYGGAHARLSRWRQVTLPHLFRQWSVRFAAGLGVTVFDLDSIEPGQLFTPAQLKELLTPRRAEVPHAHREEKRGRLLANGWQGLRIDLAGVGTG